MSRSNDERAERRCWAVCEEHRRTINSVYQTLYLKKKKICRLQQSHGYCDCGSVSNNSSQAAMRLRYNHKCNRDVFSTPQIVHIDADIKSSYCSSVQFCDRTSRNSQERLKTEGYVPCLTASANAKGVLIWTDLSNTEIFQHLQALHVHSKLNGLRQKWQIKDRTGRDPIILTDSRVSQTCELQKKLNKHLKLLLHP